MEFKAFPPSLRLKVLRLEVLTRNPFLWNDFCWWRRIEKKPKLLHKLYKKMPCIHWSGQLSSQIHKKLYDISLKESHPHVRFFYFYYLFEKDFHHILDDRCLSQKYVGPMVQITQGSCIFWILNWDSFFKLLIDRRKFESEMKLWHLKAASELIVKLICD